MSAQDAEFTNLFEHFRARDKQAAETIYQLYQPRLVRYARHRLSRYVRSKCDPEDVAHSVWCIFCKRLPALRISGFGHLLTFLKGIARHRLRKLHSRFLKYQAHDVRREQPLDDAPALVSPETPQDTASRREEWEQFLDHLPPAAREVLLLLREGHTYAEAACRLGVSEKTVRRLIHRLRKENNYPPPPSNLLLIPKLYLILGFSTERTVPVVESHARCRPAGASDSICARSTL